MVLVSSTAAALVVALLVLAAVAGVVAIGTLGYVVATNRKERLARHESIRTYYGGFALSH